MQRDLAALMNQEFDLLIIGGGIYGSCIAWDASLRGLSVALVDKGDFGNATSSNSMKIIHGGLRYLKDANLKLARTMMQERLTFMRIAPHLVHPLPFLMPTYGYGLRSKMIMSAALWFNEQLGRADDRLKDPQKSFPKSRIITREECRQLAPGVPSNGLTGGAIWYDAQIYNSERLTLSFLISAADKGANVANYVEVIGFIQDETRILGVKVRDVLSGQKLDIRARVVVNAAGPWIDAVLDLVSGNNRKTKFHPSIAMNLVTRQILAKHAVGVSGHGEAQGAHNQGRNQSAVFFIVPWQNYSLIGTIHMPCHHQPGERKVGGEDIQRFIEAINMAYPGADLSRDDITFVHHGLLPITNSVVKKDRIKLLRKSRIYDHERVDGINGLITVVGVKYTTARIMAQHVVDLVFRKLERNVPKCLTLNSPISGGDIERFDQSSVDDMRSGRSELDAEIVQNLVYTYGSEYKRILKHLDEEPKWSETVGTSCVIKAQVIHAMKEEMAHKLSDVIFRRTHLGSAGHPGEEALRTCASIMASELGWGEMRVHKELSEVKAAFSQII